MPLTTLVAGKQTTFGFVEFYYSAFKGEKCVYFGELQ